MKKNLLLIINPNSGKGNVTKKINKIIYNFEKLNYKINTIYTEKNVSILEKSHKYLEKADLIVCCGGDGTLNETISMMIKLNITTKLTFVPLGTMNDFSKTLNISKRQLFSMKKDKELKPVKVDIGIFNERYFNYIAAFGAFTEVAYETPQKLKNIFGKLAYFGVAIKYLFKIKSYEAEIEFDGKKEKGKFLYGGISNSESIGGFKWYKKVDFRLDDGKLEMILIRTPKNIIQFFKVLILLLRKKYKEPYFVFAQVKDVKFHFKTEVKWTLDGEEIGKMQDVDICNINKRIEYMVPYNKEPTKQERRNKK